MVRQDLFFIAIVFFIVVSACFAENKTSQQFVDKTIAGIVVGKDTEEDVIRQFGKGTKVQEVSAWCYYSTNQKQFIIFELGPDKVVETIIISEDKFIETIIKPEEYSSECVPIITKDKKILVTGKGIKLGDSPENIIKIYGEPKKREIKNGMLVFEYHIDYTKDPQVSIAYDAYLYFKEGKLIELHIHHGE